MGRLGLLLSSGCRPLSQGAIFQSRHLASFTFASREDAMEEGVLRHRDPVRFAVPELQRATKVSESIASPETTS